MFNWKYSNIYITIPFLYFILQVKGDWWVLWGLNCGEGEYPGGYDGYPCHHERFIKQSNGQWINNVTYCGGKKNKCSSDFIVTVANISLSHPGVIQHSYTDAPLSPQVSDHHNTFACKLLSIMKFPKMLKDPLRSKYFFK